MTSRKNTVRTKHQKYKARKVAAAAEAAKQQAENSKSADPLTPERDDTGLHAKLIEDNNEETK